MTVVRAQAWRRWSAVAAGTAMLCLVPVVLAARPAPGVTADPLRLRERILNSVERPYQGYADTHGDLTLPDVPVLADVAMLFGTVRLRAWYRSTDAWRVAVLAPTGERDVYGSATGTYTWDFERNVMTLAVGRLPVRLPSPSDLLPPELARRLLAGETGETRETAVSALPARRVAGIDAAGIRFTPTEADTTIGRVDVWADPATGLAVQIEVAARGAPAPFFTSRFLELDQTAPAPAVVTPDVPPAAGFTVVTADDIAAAINSVAPVLLPSTLTGRARLGAPSDARVVGLAAYGSGLSTFVVLALPGRTGAQALDAARARGGTPVILPGAQAYETSASVVNGLIVASPGDRRSRRTYLIAGPVTQDVLRSAALELLTIGTALR